MRCVSNPVARGLNAARNTGIAETTGELIWLPTQDPVATWRARSILRLGLGTRLALDFEAMLDGTFETAIARGNLLGLVYF